MDSFNPLDPYLPADIRSIIEERYYARVNAQAQLEVAARDPDFLRSPHMHMALISDHGVIHVRDVAQHILQVLDTIHGVLIPARPSDRLEFMKGYGVAVTYVHDIGMVDFSAFGRAMHPESATQTVLGPEFDDIVNAIWDANGGNAAGRLSNLFRIGALGEHPRIVLREMLAMANCHSKSKVPAETLNDSARLRQVLHDTALGDLRYLYHEQQVEKARRALVEAQEAQGDQAEIDRRAAALERASVALEAIARPGRRTPQFSEQVRHAYADFERRAFRWLISTHPQVRELVDDVVDTLRALRCADALRQRGAVLKTSGNYEIFVDQRTANGIYALRQQDDQLYLLEITSHLSAGEANMASSELGPDGNLRFSFHRGSFPDQEIVQRAAYCAALVVNDIQADVIEGFRRGMLPDNQTGNMKAHKDIQILLEGVDDNWAFADLVLQQLGRINPQAAAQARTVPSLQSTSERERARYLESAELDWDMATRQQALDHIARSGHKTENIDPVEGFRDVRLIHLQAGEILIDAGSPAGFVYIPLEEGLEIIPLGGYQPFLVKPWMPLGITGVIRGALRNASVVAEQEMQLLMIPKDVYLKHWHRTYTIDELAQLLASQAAAPDGR